MRLVYSRHLCDYHNSVCGNVPATLTKSFQFSTMTNIVGYVDPLGDVPILRLNASLYWLDRRLLKAIYYDRLVLWHSKRPFWQRHGTNWRWQGRQNWCLVTHALCPLRFSKKDYCWRCHQHGRQYCLWCSFDLTFELYALQYYVLLQSSDPTFKECDKRKNWF